MRLYPARATRTARQRKASLPAGSRARVRVGLAGDRHELPAVAGRMQDELEHAVRRVVAGEAVRLDRRPGVVAAPAGADHELANAARRSDSARSLPCESL